MRELEGLLEDLQAGESDPLAGAEGVAEFFEADEAIFEQCDDSSGRIGDVFQYDAKNLFVEFAARCEDKQKIAELLLSLNRRNSYGVRDVLVDCAAEYLPESIIRNIITIEQKKKQPHLSLIDLAKNTAPHMRAKKR